jgi:3-oxoacyl-[acyl-carrier protein] reductase
MELADKVAIVTGAGSGIGRSIALTFAKEGAAVVIADVDLENAQNVAEEIKSEGGKARAVKTDVSNRDDVEKMVKTTLQDYGKIDMLVNNAGIYRPDHLEDLTEEKWDSVIDVNLKGVFLCSQFAGREMIKQRKGAIINIASIAGVLPMEMVGPYGPSKAGVISLTQELALEWAKYNIRVNAISPGTTNTPLNAPELSNKEAYERRIRAIPVGKIAEPEDMAEVVLFLASERSSYVTGQNIIVDGGLTIAAYRPITAITTR